MLQVVTEIEPLYLDQDGSSQTVQELLTRRQCRDTGNVLQSCASHRDTDQYCRPVLGACEVERTIRQNRHCSPALYVVYGEPDEVLIPREARIDDDEKQEGQAEP